MEGRKGRLVRVAVLVARAVAVGGFWVRRQLQPQDVTAARARWPKAMTFEAADRAALDQVSRMTLDGERVIYASGRGARAWNLCSRRADAAGDEERMPLALSPDGHGLVYVEGSGPETGNVVKVPLDGSVPATPLFPSRVYGTAASFSPDGRWLAHESMESFDVTPNGQHFLMLRSRGREHVSLILNWPRDLARLEAKEASHP